ncbi:hypothetical protein KOR34_31030 [Posidoniimonas corsicana]|uniref:Uncharacterized protein n=1 Tax=Posidoniimonas corsicana TaxID=1938618 RepID=A0A5C5VJZ4_9BACT|nr:hypothetical protein [Posidoniimonas corsicana]TWT38135.1 hypothetical protein KOR34_31030 [Posidoniimonas corsicana]
MHGESSRWARRLYPSNPTYLISAVLVLYGLHVAFGGGRLVGDGTLLTSLFCGYTLALAGVGVLVIRLGRLWEDARTVLLVLLLMFTALSTVFDLLCLRDTRAGSINLGVGFVFSVVVSEWVLRALRLGLPLAYRAPYYLQLAVLFAFPPLLGWHSLNDRSIAMCQGVLGFAAAAGAAQLCLVGAALRGTDKLAPRSARWVWPYYPWSIFVVLGAAMAVRTWTLCVSFSPAKGDASAFVPALLGPMVFASAVVVLLLGVRRRSVAAQRCAMLAAALLPMLAEPFFTPNRAQALLLGVAHDLVGSPLFAAAVAACVLAGLGLLLRAAWSEPSLAVSVALLLSLSPSSESLRDAYPLSQSATAVLVGWIAVRAALSRWFLQVGLGAVAALGLSNFAQSQQAVWQLSPLEQTTLAVVWLLLTPLVCRDRWSALLRETAPAWILAACAATLLVLPPVAHGNPATPAAGASAVALIGLAYLHATGNRWCLAAAAVSGAAAACAWLLLAVGGIENASLRSGLRIYALGFAALGGGLLVSLAKAGYAWRALEWLEAQPATATATAGSGDEEE